MDLGTFVDSFDDFPALPEVEQIKLMSWYLITYRPGVHLTWLAVQACFNEVACPVPAGGYLAFMNPANLKPSFLVVVDTGKFQIHRSVRKEYDAKYLQGESTRHVHKIVESLRNDLPAGAESVYLEEALICLRHGAFRAAIVMAWNLAYDHLLRLILNLKLTEFNEQLPKSFSKAEISEIKCLDDFERLKESQVIQIAKSANIISPTVHMIMTEKLKRRNAAAHPTDVLISQPTAEEFVQELITNVVKKL